MARARVQARAPAPGLQQARGVEPAPLVQAQEQVRA
jgi:hypothetical protein